MSNLIGQRFGQYEITGLLGKGGMATVYRAMQTSVGREVAIKVIDPMLAETADFVLRFEREAKIVAALSHLHILKVFDFGTQGDYVYIVMEILEGGSLADMIQRGPLPAEEASRVLDQIASALDYAHRRGILHRDLKPQNILLDADGNTRLCDFGIARLSLETTRLTKGGMAMGTPSYMSPEQFQDLPLDNRVDVYALGIMLFEMLTGELPFVAKTPAEMGFKHLQAPPPPIRNLRPDLPEEVEAVIQKALAKDRDQRFSTAGDVAFAFKVALGLPISTDSSAAFRVARQQAVTNESPRPPTPSQASVPPTLPPLPPPQASVPPTLPPPLPAVQPRSKRPFLIGAIVALLIIVGISFAGLLALVLNPAATATPLPTETKVQIIALPTVALPTPTATNVPPTPVTPTATVQPSATASATATDTATFTVTVAPSMTATTTSVPTETTSSSERTASPVAVTTVSGGSPEPSPKFTSTKSPDDLATGTAMSADIKTAIAGNPFAKTPSPPSNAAQTATPLAGKPFTGTPDEIISQLVYEGLLISSDGSVVFQKDKVDLTANSAGATKTRTITSSLNVADFVISADLTWDSPDAENGCGFFFRYSVNSDQSATYYAAGITRKGTVQAISHDNDGDQVLKETDSAAINTDDGAANQILLISEGDTFRIFVNGQLADTVQDSNFSEGNLGLAASRMSQDTGLTCHFSNVFAYELQTGLQNSLLSNNPDDIIQGLQGANVVSGKATRVTLSKPTGSMTTSPNTFSALAAGSAKLSNFVVSTDVKFASADANNLYCGIIYNGTFTQIGGIATFFTRSKKLYIYIAKNSSFKGTTPILDGGSAASISTGDVNRVTLVVVGSAATLYINGKQEQTWTDTTFKSGQIGYFMVNTSNDPDLECDFANTFIWSLS